MGGGPGGVAVGSSGQKAPAAWSGAGGHDVRPPLRRRGQNAIIADHVEAGRGNERGQFFNQFQRIEDDVGRAIGPGALETVGEPAIGARSQASSRR